MSLLSVVLAAVLIALTASSGFRAFTGEDHLRRKDACRVFNRCLVALSATQVATSALRLIDLNLLQ